MPYFKSSLRTSLAIAVLVMGIVGMALAVLTGEIYRQLTFENQRATLEELVQLKIDDILDNIQRNAAELSVTVQSNSDFRSALDQNDTSQIEAYLNQQFHRYFVTLSILKLEKLYAFDVNFNLIGLSTEGSHVLTQDHLPCPNLLKDMKRRSGSERLKIAWRLCLTDNRPYVAVIVPIGGIRLKGYLLTAVDPTTNLSAAENNLGMPLLISLPNTEIVYESPQWPLNIEKGKSIISKHTLQGHSNEDVYHFRFASNVETLYNSLEHTRTIILASASLATILTAFLSLWLLQKTALNPLRALTNKLRLVREDKTHLGEQVTVTGNTEICRLAEDFNEMTSELSVLYKTLENMAFTDSLTGLPNRALFYDRLEQSTYLAQRQHAPFLLLMLDLDRFKYVNDTLGHHYGDRLLQVIGDRLASAIRRSDTIARLGGDEFAAILPTTDGTIAATIIAAKISKALNEPVHIENHRLSIGASIGIVRCPEDGTDNHQLMQRADVAMYHAKQNRTHFTFYDQELDKHSIVQFNLESDLYKAIECNNLELYYQPKIKLTTGTTIGVEALLRWKHTPQGSIKPDDFIPIAEHSGLIQPLTNWVLDTALAQCATWKHNGKSVDVAINISARSLEDNQIVEIVRNALTKANLEANALSLEITESAIMRNPDCAMEILSLLHNMGVQLTVDDFGTGYSSLAYLKKLPVNSIKIDKSFVMDMDSDNNDEVIVHSTIDLAHTMGLSVIAEGVENQSALDKLANLGCNYAQGYFLCKPKAADDLTSWFDNSRWGLHYSAKAL